jgi:hypothetical protein
MGTILWLSLRACSTLYENISWGIHHKHHSIRNRTKDENTFDHVTRSFVASSSARMVGWLMTSSGRSISAAYSMSAKHGLQPLVSRRSGTYDSRSGSIRCVR